MTCRYCRPPRPRRADLVAEIARSSRFRHDLFVGSLATSLFEAAKEAEPDDAYKLRDLARTLRLGSRFARRATE